MNAMRICSVCSKPLAANAPQGLCPECLLKAALGTGVDIGPDSQSLAESGKVPFVAPTPEELAKLFPQLEILGFIGQGGMGAVYRARQKALDRIVALKILPPGIGGDPSFAQRFAREAKALAKLNHPGIVTLYEFGQADGLFFFLMEFVDGVDLRHLLEAGRLSPREALAIVPQICDALQYAHDQGIVHRDIKPENILLDRQGRVKVADFGLAKLVGAGGEPSADGREAAGSVVLTEAGKVMGTPQYMAPEQRDHPREVDHRADIYSLGVVFYQMLTGELPGKPIESPSRKVQIDVRLDEVVLRALEMNPELRFQQVSEFKTLLETISLDIGNSTVRSQESEFSSTANTCWEAPARELQARDYILDIGSCLRRGWVLVRGNSWPAVGVTTLILLLLHVGGFLVAGPFLGGLCLFFLKKIRGEPSSVETVFSGFRIAFMPLFLAGLVGTVAGLILILSIVIPIRLFSGALLGAVASSVALACLILPGVLLAGVTILTLVLIVDKRLGFWPAFKLSGAAISRHWVKFSAFMFILALINAVGMLAGVIGLLVTFPITLSAAIFAYEDIFAAASWVAKARPVDWMTWSPFQSGQVREICARMTDAERRELNLRGALFGIWNAATFFLPCGIAFFAPKPLNWIFAPTALLVGLAFYPLWQRIMREFLASTIWAKQQSIAPESLRMSPQIILVGRRSGQAVIHWPGVLLSFVLILALAEAGVIAASTVLVGNIDSRAVGIALMSALVFTGFLIRRGLRTPVEQLKTLDGAGGS